MIKRLTFSLLLAVLVLALVGPATSYLSTLESAATATTPANDWAMALRAPPFLEVAVAAPARQGTIGDFLASEKAGITAYANVNKEINLARIEDLFRPVPDMGDDYALGVIRPSAYPDEGTLDEADVRVFVHREGWIVAYFPETMPTAAIVDWETYDNTKLEMTKLDDVIQQVADAAGVPTDNIDYFDFRYPEATTLLH